METINEARRRVGLTPLPQPTPKNPYKDGDRVRIIGSHHEGTIVGTNGRYAHITWDRPTPAGHVRPIEDIELIRNGVELFLDVV